MKVRHHLKGFEGEASRYDINTCAPQECLIITTDEQFPDYIKDYDVWLEAKQAWKPYVQAMKDRDIIVDNYFTCFFEPSTEEDRKRGYTL